MAIDNYQQIYIGKRFSDKFTLIFLTAVVLLTFVASVIIFAVAYNGLQDFWLAYVKCGESVAPTTCLYAQYVDRGLFRDFLLTLSSLILTIHGTVAGCLIVIFYRLVKARRIKVN